MKAGLPSYYRYTNMTGVTIFVTVCTHQSSWYKRWILQERIKSQFYNKNSNIHCSCKLSIYLFIRLIYTFVKLFTLRAVSVFFIPFILLRIYCLKCNSSVSEHSDEKYQKGDISLLAYSDNFK